MGGRRIEVVVDLFDVLAVIALMAVQAEQPLLQNGVVIIPEGPGKTQPLVIVPDAQQPVFGPAIRARSRVVMREIIPGIADPL